MLNLTEAEIMASWAATKPVSVSVCCITYRQEQYIAQAIDSFLMQKTTFPFEIIIGEDCGGDGTLAILGEYKSRYPNLINVITSEKNVGANANLLRVLDATKGEYIAICEGDDYWIDELKIQKQYELLCSAPDVNICFSAAKALSSNGVMKNYAQHNKNKKLFDISAVVRGGGGFMPTASLMVKANVAKTLPHWFERAPIGDYYLQVWCSIGSGALFLPETTCVYRVNAIGSWTSLTSKEKIEKLYENLNFCVRVTYQFTKFGISEVDVKYAVAMFQSQAAKKFLMRKNYPKFYAAITESWANYQKINRLQSFLYLFRRNEMLIIFAIKTYNRLVK